jgi:hypothetical protein
MADEDRERLYAEINSPARVEQRARVWQASGLSDLEDREPLARELLSPVAELYEYLREAHDPTAEADELIRQAFADTDPGEGIDGAEAVPNEATWIAELREIAELIVAILPAARKIIERMEEE